MAGVHAACLGGEGSGAAALPGVPGLAGRACAGRQGAQRAACPCQAQFKPTQKDRHVVRKIQLSPLSPWRPACGAGPRHAPAFNIQSNLVFRQVPADSRCLPSHRNRGGARRIDLNFASGCGRPEFSCSSSQAAWAGYARRMEPLGLPSLQELVSNSARGATKKVGAIPGRTSFRHGPFYMRTHATVIDSTHAAAGMFLACVLGDEKARCWLGRRQERRGKLPACGAWLQQGSWAQCGLRCLALLHPRPVFSDRCAPQPLLPVSRVAMPAALSRQLAAAAGRVAMTPSVHLHLQPRPRRLHKLSG